MQLANSQQQLQQQVLQQAPPVDVQVIGDEIRKLQMDMLETMRELEPLREENKMLRQANSDLVQVRLTFRHDIFELP
jgi:hypothetical protein